MSADRHDEPAVLRQGCSRHLRAALMPARRFRRPELVMVVILGVRKGLACDDAFAFRDRDDLIRGDVGDRLHPARRPHYLDPIGLRGSAEPEMRA